MKVYAWVFFGRPLGLPVAPGLLRVSTLVWRDAGTFFFLGDLAGLFAPFTSAGEKVWDWSYHMVLEYSVLYCTVIRDYIGILQLMTDSWENEKMPLEFVISPSFFVFASLASVTLVSSAFLFLVVFWKKKNNLRIKVRNKNHRFAVVHLYWTCLFQQKKVELKTGLSPFVLMNPPWTPSSTGMKRVH